VRVSRVGKADHIVDTLLSRFQTTRPRDQVLLIVHSMFALLRDVESFLREHEVLAQLSDEPLQEVLDDISRLIDHYMDSDAQQRPA